VAALTFDVCFSNRPFGVKHFETIRRCSVDVARGLGLLFEIGTKALPSWVSKTKTGFGRMSAAAATCLLTKRMIGEAIVTTTKHCLGFEADHTRSAVVEVGYGSSTSFRAQVTHFRFAPDSRRIAVSQQMTFRGQ